MIESRARTDTRDRASDTLPSKLPQYAKPPVIEVAISVQFDDLQGFKLVHFGLLWERLRNRYPKTEHQPPLGSVVELFGKGPGRVQLNVESSFPLGRCWYQTEDGLRLIQVQPDRFVLNWRKLDTETEYPSYDVLRGEFERELSILLAFVDDHHLGQFVPTQCELIYVNHLTAGEEGFTGSAAANVLAPWSGNTTGPYLPDLEGMQLAWQYRLEEREEPLGRLHVHFQSALRKSDQLPLFVLQLTGRGAPVGEGVEGVLAFTDRAHEWIVRGFTAITTDRMHTIWRRQR